MSLEEKVKQVEAFYAELDQDLKIFQSESKLSCLSGCSACCRNPNIEATILEFLPLAFHLYKENKAESFFDSLQQNDSSTCALYHPVLSPQRKGACSDYSYRALLCRVFGFSFTRDKEGKPSLVTCKDIKASQGDAVEEINVAANHGKPVPTISNYYVKLTEIDYHLSQQQYPINEAISKALEMVMNHFHYTESFYNENDEKLVS